MILKYETEISKNPNSQVDNEAMLRKDIGKTFATTVADKMPLIENDRSDKTVLTGSVAVLFQEQYREVFQILNSIKAHQPGAKMAVDEIINIINYK